MVIAALLVILGTMIMDLIHIRRKRLALDE